MVRTVIVQLILFLLPFLGYAIYRLLLSDAEADGRKTWPINALFGAGVVLALTGWTVKALTGPGDSELCYDPPRIVDGEVIPARSYPCDRDLSSVGIQTGNPPEGAEGVSDPESLALTPQEVDGAAERNRLEPGDG
ncbi:MAG: hypothetical protein AAF216_11265 [Pseudomonadota bacterium]